MKKQLLALAGVALLFVACSKNDDNNPQPEPNPSNGSFSGLLKGMYTVTDTTRIEYNSDKTVSKFTSGWIDGTDVGGSISTIKYENGRAVEIWESSYSESKVWGPNELTTQFLYVGDKLQKVIEPGKADNYLYYDSARYNASGKIEKIFRFGGMKPNIYINSTDSLVWTGNNITKTVHEGFSMIDGVVKPAYAYTDTYTFDDKPSWQAPLGVAAMNYSFDTESLNANNILTHTRSQKDMADRTNKYEYEYNDKNKVIKRTATYTFDQRAGTVVAVFEYYK
ncbi:hypothetical protein HF324_17295 [Chitinophaga oryzae]|uniref:DUF4595 domain-containing protein n=1 Tax=Chitinophaga oryzae TaxID=2725414 RepID=A0AAE7D8Q3_9BACT|nr:hypothetical protein [Chitinophaga oryzae]QJB33044.1 hypothetical protein HF329_17665 [Chitinophaga oryzae]QJB39518.1 hypothetical protein HF324_17295 [Chitinophaga oryzae]